MSLRVGEFEFEKTTHGVRVRKGDTVPVTLCMPIVEAEAFHALIDGLVKERADCAALTARLSCANSRLEMSGSQG
jgi:hypothetical protein